MFRLRSARPLLAARATRLAAALILAVCLVPVAAWACNVPVFRYALERWQPDVYHLSVFHTTEKPVDAETKAALDALAGRALNLEVALVNLDDAEADDWRLEEVEIDRAKLPWAALRQPPHDGRPPVVVWSGQLDQQRIAALMDSPARQEIARRLAGGESAVWVFVPGGNAERDATAHELVERELAKAEKELEVPSAAELDYAPEGAAPEVLSLDEPTADLPLKVDFSLLELKPDAPEEAALLAMLQLSEPDLHEYAGQPMVFPVFGQGRALWAIVGEGVTADNVLEACAFLTGACSCQVKSMNPGADLLIDFDWLGAVEATVVGASDAPPELTSVMPKVDDANVDDSIALAKPAPAPATAATDATAAADAPAPEPPFVAPHNPARAAAPADAASGEALDDTFGREVQSRGSFFLLTGVAFALLLAAAVVGTVLVVAKKKE